MTHNEIAYNIVSSWGLDFNTTVVNRVKSIIDVYRAKYIRQDVDRNKLTEDYVQSLIFDLEKDEQCYHSDCFFKTTINIPKIITFRGYMFKYVGSPNGMYPYSYTRPSNFYNIGVDKFSKNLKRFTYSDRKIKVFNDSDSIRVRVEAVFSFPLEIYSCCEDKYHYLEEDPYPMPDKLIPAMMQEIRERELKNVSIDKDLTDVE